MDNGQRTQRRICLQANRAGSQRTKEIGIRMAIGAHSHHVMRLILRQGARLAVIGSILGVLSAIFLWEILAGFLFGLSANDPLVLSIVPCIMVLVTLLACWLPARRATKIDPIVALRHE
jgi:ABC-type antimicrobial peptide transport system permease subunit